jgi:hypothetical protein
MDAIRKEMKNIMPAFKVLKPNASKPVGLTWIPYHMIFDIKMDFTCKARFVAEGHVQIRQVQLLMQVLFQGTVFELRYLLQR